MKARWRYIQHVIQGYSKYQHCARGREGGRLRDNSWDSNRCRSGSTSSRRLSSAVGNDSGRLLEFGRVVICTGHYNRLETWFSNVLIYSSQVDWNPSALLFTSANEWTAMNWIASQRCWSSNQKSDRGIRG